jgi:hypothetical protein
MNKRRYDNARTSMPIESLMAHIEGWFIVMAEAGITRAAHLALHFVPYESKECEGGVHAIHHNQFALV